MAKFKKVVKIILISLLILALGGYVILYIINTDLARQITATIVDYANKPLPIAGVSSIVLATLIWKIFQATGYGKRSIAKIKAEYELEKQKTKEEYEKQKTEYSAIISSYEQEIDVIYDSLIDICNASANVKVKAIGEKMSTQVGQIKSQIREKLNTLINSDVEALTKSKDEIVKEVLELIQKEMVEKYGEETINSIAEAKKI